MSDNIYQFYTYVYYDPDSRNPFLVGKGFGKRAFDHLHYSLKRSQNKYKYYKIQKILKSGNIPVIKLFYKETEQEAFDLEEFLTHHWELKQFGGLLCNLVYGGKGGQRGIKRKPLTEEHKRKISKSQMGRISPMKGKNQTEKSKRKISKALKGKKNTTEHNKHISESRKGIKFSKLHRQHISKSKIGIKPTKLAIQKRSDGLSQNWQITWPSGKIEIIHNLNQFCKENNLNPSCMYRVAQGKRLHHKGFKCQKINLDKPLDMC